MDDMSGRWSRVARGSAMALLATYVAVFAHMLGGGQPPAWQGVLATVLLGIPICTVLAGRRVRLLQTVAGVVISQYVFHALFSAAPPASSAPLSAGHGSHHHIPITLGADIPVDDMTFTHAIAAALTVLMLRTAETISAWVLRIGHRIHERFTRAIRITAVTPSASSVRLRPVTLDVALLTARAVLTSPRRGPPVVA
ncbi:hypothetical protein [Agromyces sp. Marseille-Q5079]|uniref:hypothetical protein n=1 Tax=Agromyces sp. Marseille-Q5079 TaxID=3439059 RepID=UPI003D9C98E3